MQKSYTKETTRWGVETNKAYYFFKKMKLRKIVRESFSTNGHLKKQKTVGCVAHEFETMMLHAASADEWSG